MNQSDQNNELQRLLLRAKSAEKAAAGLAAEHVQLKQSLAIANRSAKAAEQAKKRFLSNISHELRTPMNGILGMTELLNETSIDEKQSRFIQTINRSTDALLHVVNDLLDISSLEHGKIELEDNVFFLNKLVSNICKQFEPRANAKNISLVCNLKTFIQTPVIGDEQRIRQVLSKLIDNAIKFTNKGEIIIAQDKNSEEDCFNISVTDTGSGISAEMQTEIFNIFSQGDNSTTRRFGGAGLGLAIANALAELMSGKVTMQSEAGRGSKFTLICKLKAGDSESIREIGRNTLSGTKVLVVDDTATNREILELQLQQWDMKVISVESGAKALIALNQAQSDGTPFDLAILDFNMPEMDGLELAQHIKNAEFPNDLKVMMLTSSTAELSSQDLENRGILKSMMKPARQAMLHDAILNVITAQPLIHTEQLEQTTEGHHKKILLTEDDPINQEVASIMLESMGYDVVVADNGAMAVDTLLHDEGFDLVLMDCQMPVMDGFDATRAIRDTNQSIPIVALTANATKGDRQRCLDAGMNDYLTKPIHQTDLARVVEQWASVPANDSPTSTNGSEKTETDLVSSNNENSMDIQIDESALDAIRSLQRPGKPDILARIVNMYIEKTPDLISAIEEGVAANDNDKVKMAAHTLKSSSAYVGAAALAEVCNRVESNASNDDLASTGSDISMINSGFESVVSQIKQYG